MYKVNYQAQLCVLKQREQKHSHRILQALLPWPLLWFCTHLTSVKLLFNFRIKSPPQPPEWWAWWMDKAYSSPALSLDPPSLCLSPKLSTSSSASAKAHIPAHFVRQQATCSGLPASVWWHSALLSSSGFCASPVHGQQCHTVTDPLQNTPLGKESLEKHTPVNLSCHRQQIIFRDFYSTEYVGKYIYIFRRKYLVWGILQLKSLSHF